MNGQLPTASLNRHPVLPGNELDVFVVGPSRSGSALLYKLLCLHPDVAYVSNLERRLPWLPASATGRVRLRRYSSKLRHWFQDQFDDPRRTPGALRPLLDRVVPMPVDAESVCIRAGVWAEPAVDGQEPPTYDKHPDASAVARLRTRFARLKQVSRAHVLASRLGGASRRLPVIDAIFPQARYLSVIRDGCEAAASLSRVNGWSRKPLWWDERGRTPAQAVEEGEELLSLCARNWLAETREIARGLARVPQSRVLCVHHEALVATPIEQMRVVLEFLDLEPRAGYEWALKALKLDRPRGARRSAADSARADTVIRRHADRGASEVAP